MPVRASTVVRVSILFGVIVIAAAAFIRPLREGAERHSAPPSMAAPPARGAVRVTKEGFLAVDARALLDRARRSPARGTVIHAWASWCGSCKEDLPLLLGLDKTFGGALQVMLVSVDEAENLPAAADLLRGFGARDLGYVVDEPLGAFKAAINPRWPGMLPATFLFDDGAKLRYFWGGPVHEDELVPLLRRYLAGEHVDGESTFGLAPGATSR